MDALAFLLISLPIFYPIVMAMGYDPVWFGQVICIVTTMGSIMPPVGICCYVVAAMADRYSAQYGIQGEPLLHARLYYFNYRFDAGALLDGDGAVGSG